MTALLNAVRGITTLLTQHANRNITSVKKLLEMDEDHSGEVTMVEFQLFMLKSMGKFTDDDLDLLKDQFRRLDKTGDGTLSLADISDEEEQKQKDAQTEKHALKAPNAKLVV